MARGPAPQLYAVKKAAGNPGRRPLNPGPTYRAKRPRCPSNLTGEGRKIFRDLCPVLFEQSLLNESTIPAILVLCRLGGMAVEAEKVLLEKGFTVACQRGNKARPEVAIFKYASTQFRYYCQEFGLTPASVQCVPAEPIAESLEDLIK